MGSLLIADARTRDNGKENGSHYSILGLYGDILRLYWGYVGAILGLFFEVATRIFGPLVHACQVAMICKRATKGSHEVHSTHQPTV